MLKRIALAAVCSIAVVACDTSRVTEPTAEAVPLVMAGSTDPLNNTIALSGTVPAAMNPCGAGAGDVVYSGSVAVSGTMRVVGNNAQVEGQIDAGSLAVTMGGHTYRVQPNPIKFKNTFTHSTTHTENVRMTLVSTTAPNYSITVTLGITVNSAGQITRAAVTGYTCTVAP